MLLQSENVKILKGLCKMYFLKGYSNLKRQQLFETVNRYLAVKVIQRCFRRHLYKDAVDHISLEPAFFPCFIYRTKSGKNYFYNYDSIIKYIMKTGITRDPMTREHYSDNDLMRLDAGAKRANLKYRSTYKIKKSLTYARRIQNRENEILSYQMRIDELKQSILFIDKSEMYLWNLGDEPLLIENVEYQSINLFIESVFHELKMVVVNLKQHDPDLVEMFKKDFIPQLVNPVFIKNINEF